MSLETEYEDRELFDQLFSDAIEVDGMGGAKVLAAITDGNSWAYGYNQEKTHPFQKRFGTTESSIFLHAEIDAIKNWLRHNGGLQDLSECDLFIMRVKRLHRNGPWITGLSKPCTGCKRAIATFGIKNVMYVDNNATRFSCL